MRTLCARENVHVLKKLRDHASMHSFLCNLPLFFFFFLEMLTFHVTVNVLVKWKNYVDVPENGNQSVEPMGRRTVTSVWQNVSMYTG